MKDIMRIIRDPETFEVLEEAGKVLADIGEMAERSRLIALKIYKLLDKEREEPK